MKPSIFIEGEENQKRKKVYFMHFYLLMMAGYISVVNYSPLTCQVTQCVADCKKAPHCGDGLVLGHFRVL